VRLAAVACEHGVVAGAGAALIRCRPELDSLPCTDPDERLGLRLFATALGGPLRQITGRPYDPSAVPGLIADLQRRGIIDSTAMLTEALHTAVSTATTALTSAAVVLPRTRQISLTP
jgi:chaperonin GroEL (HSP60 family)